MSWRRVWIVSFVVWTGAGAFDVGQAAVARGTFRLPAFVLTFESMWLWALFTPLVLWLCLRLPLDRAHRTRSVAVHAAAAALLLIADVVVDTPFFAWLVPAQRAFAPRLAGDAFINTFSYVAVAGISYALAYGRQLVEQRARDAELESQLLRARLDAIAARLQPHFLFNALHSVTALVRSGERGEAVRAVVTLSTLLRAVLASDGDAQVPLGRELGWVRHYLDIEQIRFQDRLWIEVTVAPGVDRALVPALLLQPLVENAIRHGVEARTGAGRVTIAAWRDGEVLRLEVEDRSEGGATATPEVAGHGIGLRATRERLAHLFGAAASLELCASQAGMQARVALPFRAEGAS
jgi:two-component system, LytTR family, sensor kinase